jgi:acyl carrier protein
MDSEALRQEIKALIIESLMLEDVQAEDIADDMPLFGDGLGLDSIDALELAIAIERHFGVTIEADDERNKEIFASINALATHIINERPADLKVTDSR